MLNLGGGGEKELPDPQDVHRPQFENLFYLSYVLWLDGYMQIHSYTWKYQ